jgi:hypothetical protein
MLGPMLPAGALGASLVIYGRPHACRRDVDLESEKHIKHENSS